jgi:hypothetical protein
MSDDLVKRLRSQFSIEQVRDNPTFVASTYEEERDDAADRIEQLEEALEKARSIAKNGWITANCGTIGDADYGAELCEYIADQIAALGEKKDV